MSRFNELPKSVKKALRYIRQDIHSIEKLEEIERSIKIQIYKRKQELKGEKD
ncbi:membrane-bound transcriptional regulator LytR [Mesobacillus campisalis]|uniref:Membrane-bound transcriptional regulator LytR n=1 Tax=Mesobacillus campisalis TaxID=1408103 RepID=A0A0M2SX82_9BACI|nr:hypothetical protein [Mesobacillus campisalis]KKK38778.1 membrane-bound transcriptional regulator LytR [Mesobacillus campisalis]